MSFDRTDPADLLALKTEVETDPLGIGYAAVIDSSYELVDLLNTKNPAYTVSKPKISSALVRSTCTYDAYNNLAIDEQEWLRWMTPGNSDAEDLTVTTDLRTNLTDGNNSIWAAANRVAMNAAMLALIDVPGSRAEVLFGIYTTISRDDWIAARDS